MKSMTGFGKSEIAIGGRKLRIEIKSVNNRFLDINIRQPKFMLFLESHAKDVIKEYIARGRVDVFINYYSERDDAKKVTLDLAIVNAYVNAAVEIASSTGLENDLSVAKIIRFPDVIAFEEDASDENALKELLETNLRSALVELTKSREKEAANLEKDIIKRLNMLTDYADTVKAKESVVIEEYKQKLETRINEILSNTEVDEQRLAQEVAFFADKSNVTEEVVRIKSHVEQFISATKGELAQGRNMDFIVQELNREFNTIGSKSSDTELIKIVIDAKAQIEKIREQIQNIE